ncbi:MAG: hydroxymethylbilane synthase [Pseudonocardiales bacterium]|nr:hydroxymethylbilane synthase [Pseudonocardiales bacterium]MBV9029215.1 hydroxymethylbilane synthase [Pseudonocardiales bacterium]MBW0009702.1 hydroxymethylbilane synthase [Pseudonocardiales bacterium]
MPHVRIGTRASPMALHQAEQVGAALEALNPTVTTELIKITTSGDQWMGDLAKLGGKGAFVRAIDRNLLDGSVDLAVHCLKDIPGEVPVPEGLTFAGYLPRENIHDAVISRTGDPLAELPPGAVIGTSAVRRAAQLRLHYPGVVIKPLRGNVNTRLMRLDEGHFDAIVAAVAGLYRVDEAERITEILPLRTMCPAIGAGIIALQCRATDTAVRALSARLNDAETDRHATAERAMLHALQGHCNSPIAGYASTEPDGKLALRAKVFSLDGSQWLDSHHWGVPEDPAALGYFVGADLLRQGARALIDATRH